MIKTKKLIAYQISGQTCGVDISTWEESNLNGNDAFNIINSNDSIPNDYVDISSIENWDKFGINVANDYSVIKFAIKNISNYLGWSGLTNTEKDLSIQYYSYPDSSTAIIYLMTVKGMIQQDAIDFLTLSWHKHHLKTISAYIERWKYAKFTVLKHITSLEGEDLFTTVKPLIDLFIDVGVIGIDFNDNQNGIYDYIYSIHGFVDNGLEENNYTLLQGIWSYFKQDLYDVLISGNYKKYN